ncbi:MAG: gamma-glutamyltransferase [Pirellulaceae bacterium]
MKDCRYFGSHRSCCVMIVLLVVAALGPSPTWADPGQGARGMVVSVHPLATDAGLKALKAGGNAVDAAVAAALTLGVVDGFNSGIGGGCFILIRRQDGTLLAIDGREMAPARAHRDMYLRDGKPQSELSKVGPLASGVPGALAAYELAIKSAGKTSWRDLVLPASQLAKKGFIVDEGYARKVRSVARYLARYEGSRGILLHADGSPLKAGEKLQQPDLAAIYQQVAEQGAKAFYRGKFAQLASRWMAQNGGLITIDDFANYQAKQRRPIVTAYRGHTVVGFPPPSSGGIHVAQILNILEHFDLKQLFQDDRAKFVNVIAEAMKVAFADRAHWLGDADFVRVPKGLIDKSYAKQLAGRINPGKLTPVKGYGSPPDWQNHVFGKHTTHITAADAAGNWVAITATVNTSFGSKVIIPGTGVVMNNEMDDFSIAPGVPNAFGLLGAEANAVAPGKRPLSSMSPTIVLRDGQPVLTIGAAGGPRIITQVLLGIVHHLDLEMPIQDALAIARFHHQWAPDRLYVERTMGRDLVMELKELGHRVETRSSVGISQAISYDPAQKQFSGVHDPRIRGKAAGF